MIAQEEGAELEGSYGEDYSEYDHEYDSEYHGHIGSEGAWMCEHLNTCEVMHCGGLHHALKQALLVRVHSLLAMTLCHSALNGK
jgi:hypothetical protein